jgi:hypothetical protein
MGLLRPASRGVFPVSVSLGGPIGGERETAGDWKGSLSTAIVFVLELVLVLGVFLQVKAIFDVGWGGTRNRGKESEDETSELVRQQVL